MLSRLKRRTPSSLSATEHDHDSNDYYTQDYIDQAQSIAAQQGHLDPNSLSPASTRSRGFTNSSSGSSQAARTLSPSRAHGKGGRASRSSSFGSFVERPDMRHEGRYVAVREGGGGHDIGAGSLTLDHLDGPVTNAGDRSSTLLARAPELMINTTTTEGDTQSRDSGSSVESTSELRTPQPGAGGQEQYFSSTSNGSRSRSRANTTNDPPSLNGLQALAGLNGSPSIPPSYSSSSSLDPSSAGPPSVSSSRPVSRSSSIKSQQRPHAPPISTSPVQSKPVIRKQRSTQGGITGALALSGAALAGAQVRTTTASASARPVGWDSSDLMDTDGSGGEANSSLVSVDGMGDFDDVVSQLGTGYAVASSKRNAEFHSIFKSIPDDDYLIEGESHRSRCLVARSLTLPSPSHPSSSLLLFPRLSSGLSVPSRLHLASTDYGCALQREILIQGRLYISEHHLSFNANIFGWVTTVRSGLSICMEDRIPADSVSALNSSLCRSRRSSPSRRG